MLQVNQEIGNLCAISLCAKIPGKLTNFVIVGAYSSRSKWFLPLSPIPSGCLEIPIVPGLKKKTQLKGLSKKWKALRKVTTLNRIKTWLNINRQTMQISKLSMYQSLLSRRKREEKTVKVAGLRNKVKCKMILEVRLL